MASSLFEGARSFLFASGKRTGDFTLLSKPRLHAGARPGHGNGVRSLRRISLGRGEPAATQEKHAII